MNITVYCGANPGRDPEFTARAAELGSWMAANGHRLVYGAGNAGLMGAVVNAVLEGGGEVTGVTPDFFIIAEEIHSDITDLRVTKDMTERRQIMMDEGDAFIALPGGTGTLDEISEVMSLRRLGKLGDVTRPIMLYNINGYYDYLFKYLDRMTEEGFHSEMDRAAIHEVRCLEDIQNILHTAGLKDINRNDLYDAEV